jgi:hypothetical protein
MLATTDLRIAVFVLSLFLTLIPVLYIFNIPYSEQMQKSSLSFPSHDPANDQLNGNDYDNDIPLQSGHNVRTGRNRLDRILSNLLSDPTNKTNYRELPPVEVATSQLQLEYEMALGLRAHEYASASAISKCLSEIPNKKLAIMGDSVSRHM